MDMYVTDSNSTVQWVLVLWVEEDAVSIVRDSSIVFPKSDYPKGTMCKVKYGRQVLYVKILDFGELQCTSCIGQ